MKSRRSAKRTMSSGDEGPSKDTDAAPSTPTPVPATRTKTSSRKIKKKVYPDSIYHTDSDKQLVIDIDEEESMQDSSLPKTTPTPSVQPTTAHKFPASTIAQSSQQSNKKKKPTTKPANKDNSGSSSDEERWLEKIKDPKMMTARQRAMYDRENVDKEFVVPPEALVSLPTGYKEKVLTAEAIERAQVKSAKRKMLADEKREKDKRKTMDRLLKKQESKLNRVNKSRQLKPGVPIITYKSTREGCLLILPPDFNLQLGGGAPHTQDESEKKSPLCGVCLKESRRYDCSKTNVPLCSLQCYQENLRRMIV